MKIIMRPWAATSLFLILTLQTASSEYSPWSLEESIDDKGFGFDQFQKGVNRWYVFKCMKFDIDGVKALPNAIYEGEKGSSSLLNRLSLLSEKLTEVKFRDGSLPVDRDWLIDSSPDLEAINVHELKTIIGIICSQPERNQDIRIKGLALLYLARLGSLSYVPLLEGSLDFGDQPDRKRKIIPILSVDPRNGKEQVNFRSLSECALLSLSKVFGKEFLEVEVYLDWKRSLVDVTRLEYDLRYHTIDDLHVPSFVRLKESKVDLAVVLFSSPHLSTVDRTTGHGVFTQRGREFLLLERDISMEEFMRRLLVEADPSGLGWLCSLDTFERVAEVWRFPAYRPTEDFVAYICLNFPEFLIEKGYGGDLRELIGTFQQAADSEPEKAFWKKIRKELEH